MGREEEDVNGSNTYFLKDLKPCKCNPNDIWENGIKTLNQAENNSNFCEEDQYH